MYNNEEEWPQVRKALHRTLTTHPALYTLLFQEIGVYERLLDEVPHIESPCNRTYWMAMPYIGYVIADTFERPVHLFSEHESVTFLPHFSPLTRHSAISIAFINQCHFISIYLRPMARVPPITQFWKQNAAPAALIWEKLFENRLMGEVQPVQPVQSPIIV